MKKSTRTWLMVGGAAAAAWWLFGRKDAPKADGNYIPAPTPPTPKPVCSGPFRYGWNSSSYDEWYCWDFCDGKRVDDAVCELG